MKKKMISLLLVLALVVGICPAAFAGEMGVLEGSIVTENEMDEVLLQRGYPQIYLEHLAQSAKKSLYDKPDVVFAGATISTYDAETGQFTDYDISADGIALCGQIPDSDLSLTWGIAQSTTSENVFVSYSYQWHSTAAHPGQDPIGVSWDDECFKMIDNSFYKVDYYYPNLGVGQSEILSEARNYATASDAGVTWYATQPALWQNSAMNFGHGEFWLKPQKKGTFSTIFYGRYVHKKGSLGSISLVIPQYGFGFSVSGNADYDELGNQRTFTYR